MRRLLVFAPLTLLFWPATVSAQPEIHSKHWLFGYPTGGPTTNDLVIRDLYALSSNDQTKFADWVAYRLTAMEVVGSLDLEREWRSDPWLESDETLEATPSNADDYRGAHDASDYDRGHLGPLGSFKGSRNASQVNYYSNILPQKGDLNQGPWQALEQAERDIVCAGNVLWVMTGPLFDGAPSDLLPNADEQHQVPTGFWKILATRSETPLWTAAFVFEQGTPRDDPVEDHLTSIDNLEQRSGLDFFRLLDGAEEDALEGSTLPATEWVNAVPSGSCNSARVEP
jgi:endonuclease G